MPCKCSVCKKIFLKFEEYQKHNSCSFNPNYIKQLPDKNGYVSFQKVT